MTNMPATYPARKGQTALEYLLVIVIAIMVVVSIVLWLYPTFVDIKEQGGKATDRYICGNTDCPTSVPQAAADANCTAVDACGASATCDMSIGKCQIN